MRVADRVAVSPALPRRGRVARARRQIDLASLRSPGRHCRRPIHHCQLRARRRLRVDARLRRRAGRHRLTNPGARRGRTAARHHRRARSARPPRRAGAARLRQLGQHHADARRRRGRPPFLIDLDRRCFTVAPADAPNHRPAHPDGRRRSPPVPGDRPPVAIRGGDLAGIQFSPETPSAQVKSAVLLAGLQAAGRPWSSSLPLLEIIRNVPCRRSAPRSHVAGRRISPAGRPAAARAGN